MLAFRFVVTSIALAMLLLAPQVSVAESVVAPPVEEDAQVAQAVRPRPLERPFENEWSQPEPTESSSESASSATPTSDVTRMDDPVLYWLPEITTASNATGTPRSLIAGIMRLESSGDPGTVSVVSAQGLMQVMPAEMRAQGIPQEKWQDPATNIMAGAVILKQRSGAGWETAAAYYFGIGCDAYGTCTKEYVQVVMGYANFYAGVLLDPYWYDASRIPEVPSRKNPSPLPTGTATPVPPGATPTPVTTAPTDPGTPVETPGVTLVPTQDPAPQPTAVPTEVPTEAPPPPPEPTEPPAPPVEEPPAPAPAEETVPAT